MGSKLNLTPFFYMYNKKKTMLPLIADTTAVTSTDFGVFGQLADYGPLGLAVLALGYVAWMFLKRHLAEKDRLQEELKAKSTPKTTRKTKK
jgi:hypothetical protein